jgi:hypothetical protein
MYINICRTLNSIMPVWAFLPMLLDLDNVSIIDNKIAAKFNNSSPGETRHIVAVNEH